MTESVDGRRWPQRAVTPDAPPRPETSLTPAPDQQDGVGADLPLFDVYAGFVMRPDSVALHFPLDAVPALAELFPQHADALHAAALDVEMEAERQQDATAWRAS